MGKAKSNATTTDVEIASNVTAISAAKRSGQNPAPEGAADKAPSIVEASLVVFGRDDGGKPHASWFGAADAELATKAAGLMRFKVLPITSDEHRTTLQNALHGVTGDAVYRETIGREVAPRAGGILRLELDIEGQTVEGRVTMFSFRRRTSGRGQVGRRTACRER